MNLMVTIKRHRDLFKAEQLLIFLVGIAFFTGSAAAQSVYTQAYTFTTFAGLASVGNADGVGNNAQFNSPQAVAVDSAGNVYVADSGNCTIRKLTPTGVVTTLAGLTGFAGSNDGTGSAARFNYPYGVAVDSAGNVYVTDTFNATIRKVTPEGVVTTLAGLAGSAGYNNGTGSAARFNYPVGVAVDTNGNVYVTDNNYVIRKVTPGGMVTALAGSLDFQGSADGTGANAQFEGAGRVAVDNAGNLYVADYGNGTLRKVTPTGTNWVVTTLAGLAMNFGTNDGTGSTARFGNVDGVAADSSGNIYVSDTSNNTIRKVTRVGTNWVVTTMAGAPGMAGSVNGTGNAALFYGPRQIAADANGNIYVADPGNSSIRKITAAALVSSLAGIADTSGSVDSVGSNARFFAPTSVAVDQSGNLFVADLGNNTIRQITPAGLVSTIAGLAGSTGTNDGVGSNARFNQAYGVAVDRSDNVYVADTLNSTIRKVTPTGVVTTLVGRAGSSGTNDGMGNAARFDQPHGMAMDSAGNLYVADTGNSTLRKVTPTGTNWAVTTLAGLAGIIGANDGTGNTARFDQPNGVAVDTTGNIYLADTGNFTIRKITSAGVVTTIAGSPGVPGSQDGAGSSALFGDDIYAGSGPEGVAVDGAGNVYVCEPRAIREISPAGTNWVVSTIGGLAGLGGEGSADGAGIVARFFRPHGIAVDNVGNVYVADTTNNTIRKGVFTQYSAANAVSYIPPQTTGQLQITLLPPQANGQWRFPWETAWHSSGFTASGLAPGSYPVEFRNRPGWLAIPPSLTITNPAVVLTNVLTQITNTYYPTLTPTSIDNTAGSLTINLGANPPVGAGWRFLGDTNIFFASNFSTNLLPGTYLIEFAGPFNNRATPPNASVQVFAGQSTFISVTYPFAAAPPANVLLPSPVASSQINDVTDYPFGFNGQLQTEVGFGSGVVVQSNVVLTAAHLLFNDDTQSYVGGAYWFPQEDAPTYSPTPLIARGEYLLSGYAAQRTNDLSSGIYGPDVSSPQSRNLDVAALYFSGPVASGGYGGYLPSDAVPNQWLTSTAGKMLVGYPVDGSL